jgi:hypothetical protein
MVEAEQQLGTQTLLVVDVRSTVIYNNRKPNVLIQHVVLSLPGNRIRLIIHVHHSVGSSFDIFTNRLPRYPMTTRYELKFGEPHVLLDERTERRHLPPSFIISSKGCNHLYCSCAGLLLCFTASISLHHEQQ